MTQTHRKPSREAGGFFWGLVRVAFIIGVVMPVALTLVFRFAPPPVTYLMVQRAVEGNGLDYRWRPISRISPNLVNAAIAAEDARYCDHRGFDFAAIEKAAKNNARGRRLRGGSTISQQTAKNVFLWPGRSRLERWVRKGFETYFTILIETLWGKRRTMEVYLNVAEMGPGIYGAEAAAQRYFNKPARNLTPSESARIVSVLPNPLRYKAVNSGPYVRNRARAVGGNAATVRAQGLSRCVLR